MRWIVFGEDWCSHPSSTQHLFKRILADDEVIWINSMGLRAPRLDAHDLKRAYRKALAMLPLTSRGEKAPADTGTGTDTGSEKALSALSAVTRADTPRHLVAPRSLPFYGSTLIRQLNRTLLRRQLEALPHTDQPTVLWISLPSAADMVGQCGEDFSIYYCGDDFASLAGVDHDVVSGMEAELAERCDLILTASEQLAGKFPMGKTRVLAHGVDYDCFQQPKAKPRDFPMGKVMGFYGQLADWVDIDLLCRLADKHTDWTLMLIGASHTDTKDLLERPNVCWMDAIPHDQLAAYCQHWTLALLPFRPCQQIEHCNPLKLREYLSTGTEIISLRFPAAEPYGDFIRLADNADDFVIQVQQFDAELSRHNPELSPKNPEIGRQKRLSRQQRVQSESWEARVDQVRALIRQRSQFLAARQA